MRVFVTGAAGFIGSHLSEALVARGDEVVGFDAFDAFYPRAVKERNIERLRSAAGFRLVEGDVRDAAALAAALAPGFDLVVHVAALAGVRPSVEDPARFADVNVVGSVRLIEAARASGVRRFVLASSSSVYGDSTPAPFREDAPCDRPASPYAATKRAMELAAHAAAANHGLGIICLRYFTVYGPRQRPDLAIHKFARCIEAGAPVPFFGDGATARDYTYVDDIVAGTLAACDRMGREAPAFAIYNLGGADVVSLSRLVALLEAALGKRAVLDRRPMVTGDVLMTHADLSSARRDLGFAPRVGMEEGLRRFAAWLRG